MKSILVLAILSGAALAQEFPSTNMRSGADEVSAIFGPPRPEPVITGAPFSAEQIQEYNGDRNVIGRFARDGQGRTRAERAFKFPAMWRTTIYDPVAAVAYLLEDAAKVAHRMALPPYDPAAARPAITGPNDE